jgi:hypothetical protein
VFAEGVFFVFFLLPLRVKMFWGSRKLLFYFFSFFDFLLEEAHISMGEAGRWCGALVRDSGAWI